MTNKFLKGYNKGFFERFVPLKPLTYTIVIVYIDGHQYEVPGIEKPFAYIRECIKNPNVKTAYISS
jgi:hypothetical protein